MGTASSQALLALSSIVIARLYAPAEFGVFAIATSIVSIFGNIINLKYDQAQMIALEDDRPTLLKASFLFSFVFAIFLFFGSYIEIEIDRIHQMSVVLSQYNWQICLWALLFSLIFSLRYAHLAKNNFKRPAITLPIRAIAIITAQISFALSLEPNVYSLLYGQLIGEFLAFSILIFDKGITFKSLSPLKKTLKKYKEFPLITTPNYLLHTLTNNLDSILILGFYNKSTAGFYALALKILNAPINLISNSIRDAFFKKISDYNHDSSRILKNFIKISSALFSLSIIPFGIIYFWGEDIFKILFGENWAVAGNIASQISVYLCVLFSLSPIFALLKVVKKQKYHMVYQTFQLIFRFGLIVLMASKLDVVTLTLYLSLGSTALILMLTIFTLLKLKRLKT
jgi:O-antigen/teichoic acid export membrane protein